MLPMLEFILLIAILAIILIFAIRYYLSYHFDYWQNRRIVGPKPQLYVGTFPKTNAGAMNLIEELHEIYLEYRQECPCVGVFSAREPILFVLSPMLANEILVSKFKYFHDNESSRWTTPQVERLRLCSPFVSTGECWRRQRAELTPALTLNKLRAQHETLQRTGEKLVQFITAKSKKGGALDAKEIANRFTLQFVSQFIWSIDADSLNASNDSSELSQIHTMAEEMVSQALRCVNYYGRTANWPWLRNFWPVRFFTAANERFFRKLTRDAIHRWNEHTSSVFSEVFQHLILLGEKKGLNETQITGHTTTMLIDGYETVAMVIAHSLLLLARNDDIQHKLRQELKKAGNFNELDHDSLNKSPYLDQCLMETLRLLPPLPTLFKLCTEKINLRLNDADPSKELLLCPGDTVYISAYSFHLDEQYYEEPFEFRPERFDSELGGVGAYRDKGVFLPFGAGPRMCPGMKLGLLEAKYAVAAIVSHFHITCSPTTRLDSKLAVNSFLLTVADGIILKFEEI